jgi:hypothetical protein
MTQRQPDRSPVAIGSQQGRRLSCESLFSPPTPAPARRRRARRRARVQPRDGDAARARCRRVAQHVSPALSQPRTVPQRARGRRVRPRAWLAGRDQGGAGSLSRLTPARPAPRPPGDRRAPRPAGLDDPRATATPRPDPRARRRSQARGPLARHPRRTACARGSSRHLRSRLLAATDAGASAGPHSTGRDAPRRRLLRVH